MAVIEEWEDIFSAISPSPMHTIVNRHGKLLVICQLRMYKTSRQFPNTTCLKNIPRLLSIFIVSRKSDGQNCLMR
jgi:hypothetical protein